MLTDKEKKLLAQSEKQLAIPKWRFVFIYGVIFWGIFTALLITFVNSILMKGKTLAEAARHDIWINLITFMTAGIFFGLALRWLSQKQVKKLKEKEAQS